MYLVFQKVDKTETENTRSIITDGQVQKNNL